MPQPIAENDRIILRQFELTDAAGFYHLNAAPEVIKHTGDQPFTSEQEAFCFIKQYDDYRRFGYGRWALVLKPELQFAGFCGLKFHADTGETDLGFRLHKKFWGRGIAKEASRLVLQVGFQQFQLATIIGRCMQANRRSARLLAKLGFKKEKQYTEAGTLWLQMRLSAEEFKRAL